MFVLIVKASLAYLLHNHRVAQASSLNALATKIVALPWGSTSFQLVGIFHQCVTLSGFNSGENIFPRVHTLSHGFTPRAILCHYFVARTTNMNCSILFIIILLSIILQKSFFIFLQMILSLNDFVDEIFLKFNLKSEILNTNGSPICLTFQCCSQ